MPLRRSLSSANSHPPWAMMSCRAAVVGSLCADVRLAEPPHVSELRVPKHLIKTRGSPDPSSDVLQSLSGAVSAASGDGLLFLSYLDLRFTAPVVGKQGARRVRLQPTGLDPTHLPNVTRFVCNPLTRELSRLPDFVSNPVGDILCGPHMGLLTQADRGQGPPDRFALAVLHENLMLRFLSKTEEWQAVAVSPCQLPLARRTKIDQEPLAFGGRLWWVDVTWGAISADPLSDRPELCFVELPRGSVLSAGAQDEAFRRGRTLPDAEGNVWWKQAPARYRRVGVSEERLRYVEVSQKEPFLLSSFALDDEGSGWTLEYRVALSKLWADGSYPWLPLQEGKTSQIGLLDPLNANVVYLTVDEQALVGVDMDRKEVIGGHLSTRDSSFIPCVLPPWLGSCSIPFAGKMDSENKETLADVLVRSEIP